MPSYLVPVVLLMTILQIPAHSQVRWLDGTKANAPQGALLTPNVDYYGECVSTGVTYEYETPQVGKADAPDDDKAFLGKRLFDGVQDYWYSRPAGPTLQSPGSVIFDFKRVCKFNEIDLLSETKHARFQVEVSSDKFKWKTVYDSKEKVASTSAFRRLAVKASGRYLRLRVETDGTINLAEAWVWGNVRMSEKDYADLGMRSTLDLQKAEGLQGIPATKVSDSDYAKWLTELKACEANKSLAVWSQVFPWNSLASGPILPNRTLINKSLDAVMCRNEAEPVAVYLTNTSRNRVRTLNLELSGFVDASGKLARSITGELHIFGVQQSKAFGPTPYVLLSENNKPGRDVLRRYCLNAAQVMDFPTVRLSPAGSAILWVKIRTDNCLPGKYSAVLSCKEGPSIRLDVNVADIILPHPKVWVNYWTNETNMAPFRAVDWVDKEARVRKEMGMNVVDGWPEGGTGAEALYKINKQTLFKIWGMGTYGYKLWSVGHQDLKFGISDFTPDMREDLKNIIRAHAHAASLFHLDYSQWFIETADEPNPKCLDLFGEMAKVCKEADPNVMIYANPCGWLGLPDKVVEDDSTMYPTMKDWYNKYIDISVPGFLNLIDAPNTYKLYTAPRSYNALYDVMGSKTRSDNSYGLINYPRYLAWLAIRHGMNGWAYYSIYQPRGNPWDDNDQPEPDYLTILPGPNGPVISRGSEASGEAYEDYCLMSLLKDRKPDVHARLISEWLVAGNYESARNQAIQALSGK